MIKLLLYFICLLVVGIFSLCVYYLLLNQTEKQNFWQVIKENTTDSSISENIYMPSPEITLTPRVFPPTSPSPLVLSETTSSISPTKYFSSNLSSYSVSGDSHVLLLPDNLTFQTGQRLLFHLYLIPSASDSTKIIDYLKTDIQYNQSKLIIPETSSIDTSSSGLGRLLKVDTPQMANSKGMLTIELGSFASSMGPVLNSPLKIAVIEFQAIGHTIANGKIIVGKTQAVGNDSKSLSIITQETNYTIE